MTLEELESTLPNGFHDAVLRSISINYADATASLVIDVDVQDCGVEPLYRTAVVSLSGLVFITIEPPGGSDARECSTGLVIDAGPGMRAAVPSPPDGAFVHWIYVSAWNSFIHIAARDASLAWQ